MHKADGTVTKHPRGSYQNQGEATDVQVTLKVSEYMLAAILIDFIEGGYSRHWCRKVRLRNTAVDGWDPEQDAAPENKPFDELVTVKSASEAWTEFLARNVALGGTLTVYELDEDTGASTPHRLTKAKLVSGLAESLLFFRKTNISIDETTGFADIDIDGPHADFILQHALFGRQIYG